MSVLCALPVIASLLSSCAAQAPLATGYVEGDFTLVAPVQTAQVAEVLVERGDRVAAGTVLVRMEQRDAEIALAQAEANLAAAEGQLADLREGARPEEIEVIEAELTSAQAQAAEAGRVVERQTELANRGVATATNLDDALTAAEVARAKVATVQAQLAVARLPARPQAIAQAEAAVTAATAVRDQAKWVLDQRVLSLPVAVTVFDVIRTGGEIAGPSAPVLSVLDEAAVKLRLYVPEARLAEIAVGDRLVVRCDGCPDGLGARISYISDAPEFTPPVIYSLQNRQKLVYLIEARGDGAIPLKPGQIVDVTLGIDE